MTNFETYNEKSSMTIKELNNQIAILNQNLQENQNENQKFREEISNLSEHNDELNSKLKELNNKINKLTNENKKLKIDYNSKNEENQNILDKLDIMNKDFRYKNNKYISLVKQMENYKIMEQNYEKIKIENNELRKEKNQNFKNQ